MSCLNEIPIRNKIGMEGVGFLFFFSQCFYVILCDSWSDYVFNSKKIDLNNWLVNRVWG